MECSFSCGKFGILRMNVGRALLPVSDLPDTLARRGFDGQECPSYVKNRSIPT